MRHFKFVTMVDRTGRGAGGWRVACLLLTLKNDAGAHYVCKVGVEVPMKTRNGTLHLVEVKRLAADCANTSADLAFAPTTPTTPLGMACTSFIRTYLAVLGKALVGSRVTTGCVPEAESVAP